MKRFLILSIFMLTGSLACQTVQRALVPAAPTSGATPPTAAPSAPSATVAATDASESAPSPIVTRVAPTPITCTDDSCLNACLDRINEQLSTHSQEEIGGEYAGTDSNFNLVTYTVNGNQISEPDVLWVPSEYKTYQQDTGAHERVWAYFVSLIPSDQRKWITKYTVFTDGYSNTLAWVGQQDYDDNSRWELGVDILDAADPMNLTETLIHEVAHLITLNSDQIIQSEDFMYTPYQNTAICPQFLSTEGCSTPESYINAFYRTFWLEIYEDWLETVYKSNPADEEEFFKIVNEFYARHSEQFARPYAATNIKEDLAVSFEYFILRPKASGSGVSAQKMRFFYDYPELVALRQQMIQAMCSYAQ